MELYKELSGVQRNNHLIEAKYNAYFKKRQDRIAAQVLENMMLLNLAKLLNLHHWIKKKDNER